MRIEMKNKKEIWIYIVSFLISISVIGLYPNLRSKVFIVGHDFGYQLLRTEALYHYCQEIGSLK